MHTCALALAIHVRRMRMHDHAFVREAKCTDGAHARSHTRRLPARSLAPTLARMHTHARTREVERTVNGNIDPARLAERAKRNS